MGAEGGQRREGQKTPKSEGVEEAKADKSGKIKVTRAGGGGVENGHKKRASPTVWTAGWRIR